MTYFCLNCRQNGRIVVMSENECQVCSSRTAVVFMGRRHPRPDDYAVWPAQHRGTEAPVQ